MSVVAQLTPNPNAMKFTVGDRVGGPATFRAGQDAKVISGGQDAGHPLAAAILAIEGVASVFWTADFVTVNKVAEGDWSTMRPVLVSILEDHFGKG